MEKGGKKLRCGYTTGSCAAAASKAALIMLLDGRDITNVKIITPKGPEYVAEIEDIKRDEEGRSVSCAVTKDGGDDPDATSGMKIYATVTVEPLGESVGTVLFDSPADTIVEIDGGYGIGRVTRPGLDQPIGNAAINSVPRKMIEESILEVLRDRGITGRQVKVIISAPEGESVAQKTFNPKLGITGGISILGTTGIVEPMSDEAILATIRTEISIRKAEGRKVLLMAPGNYGLKFLSDNYGITEDDAVTCSNFVYDSLKYAQEACFNEVLFVGHLGKLIKVAGGIKNTHSAFGDRRMEILSDITKALLPEGADVGLLEEIQDCVMTDAALSLITEAGLRQQVAKEIAGRIKRYMESWTEGNVSVETIVFSGDYEELVESPGAGRFMEKIKLETRA
ncbi:MAG: cobalamin biosynthesis protein CbiD [Butyrivibrio sp.]|nr:cobalamin biosynthesis protein CbiD [Butyrivibrio sp.]